MNSKKKNDEIPYPHLNSWMFGRSNLKENVFEKEITDPDIKFDLDNFDEALISRLILKMPLNSQSFNWTFYKLIKKIFKLYFKIFHRLSVNGLENIPSRAIFIVNHPGSLDPFVLVSAFPKPVSCFISLGFPWLEKGACPKIGFLPRFGTRDNILEMITRSILKKNSYFAMWPEGIADRGTVMKGYSGIVRIYSVINSKRNIIPFIPVYIRGSECYLPLNMKPSTNKISIEFLKPRFIPREWLKEPQDGGKTPREIIDYLMNILARKNGQNEAVDNNHIEIRRKSYTPEWGVWTLKNLRMNKKQIKKKQNQKKKIKTHIYG